MRSAVTKRILDKTSEETKAFVRLYAALIVKNKSKAEISVEKGTSR